MTYFKTISTFLLTIFCCNIIIAQNNNATYFQIANMGKQLYQITEGENEMKYQQINFNANEMVYLLAYNHKSDNLLALTAKKDLLTINKEGKIIERKTIENINKKINMVISTTDNKGNLYVGSSDLKEVYKINLKNYKSEKLSFGEVGEENQSKLKFGRANNIYDLAFVKNKKAFYALNMKGELIAFDSKTFSKKTIAKLEIPAGIYGSVWYDGKNQIFAHHNSSSAIYSIDLKTNKAQLRDVAPFFGAWNDGTACFKNKNKQIENANPVQTSQQIRIAQNISDIVLSPNPNNGIFKVKFNSNYSKTAMLKIMDMTGKVIYNNRFRNNATIDLTGTFAAGAFLIQIIDNEVVVDSKKFIMN